MRFRTISNWMISALIASSSSLSLAAEFNDEFANGIDPGHWVLAFHDPGFFWDDSGGNLFFNHPEDPPGEGHDGGIGFCYSRDLVGDFDVSVDFSDASITCQGCTFTALGLGITIGDHQIFNLGRNYGQGEGDVVGVWADPPGSWISTPVTATAGRLRVTRVGATVTGYFNDSIIHSGNHGDDPVTRVYLYLSYSNSSDPLSVRFDNFSLVADDVGMAKQVTKLAASDAAEGDWFGLLFGSPVAAHGDTLVVGASLDDNTAGTDAGSAYVFHRSGTTWTERQKLVGSDTESGDNFGGRTAVFGDTLFITAAADDHSDHVAAGSVYVFRRTGDIWAESQKLVANDPLDNALFGWGLAAEGETLVVTAANWGASNEAGSADVFTLSGESWIHQQELIPSGDADLFGQSVAVSGDMAVVSAPMDDHSELTNAGAAYVFTRSGNNWTQRQKITASDAEAEDQFGSCVSMSGDTLFISAQFDEPPGRHDTGSIYVFRREGDLWIEEQKIGASDSGSGDWFGDSQVIDGDIAVVTAVHHDHSGYSDAGAVYLFTRSGGEWTEMEKITARDADAGDHFGWGVAVAGDTFVIGAPDDDLEDAIDGGSVYIYGSSPYPDEYALPAVARVQGAGAFFTSKWILFNSSEGDLVVSMTYTPRVDFGGPPQTVQYTVPGGDLQEITDPLLEIFSISDDAVGSVIMQVPDGSIGDLMVQSVVFAQLDDGSEFGQFFPARRLADAIQAGDTAYLTTTEDPTHNRVNLGMMAAEDGTRIKVTPVGPIGTALADPRQYNLNFSRSRQVNNIHGTFGLGNRPDVLLEVEVLDGAALVYGSVVDGKGTYAGTSDPTTIQPVSNGAFNVILLELGPVSGYNEFSGSASITNHSPNPAEISVDFCDRSAPGIAASTTLTLAPGETFGYGDIVGDLIGLENSVGTVMLSSDNGTLLSATGREFAIFEDGEGNVTGTAGQLMEGLTGDDILNPGKTHHFIGLRQVESGDSLERSHIAFFNAGSSRVDATLNLYGDDGQLEGTWTRAVQPMELVHVNNIIDRINPSQDGEVKRLEVTVNGPVYARAFRVNPYGDPITIEPCLR